VLRFNAAGASARHLMTRAAVGLIISGGRITCWAGSGRASREADMSLEFSIINAGNYVLSLLFTLRTHSDLSRAARYRRGPHAGARRGRFDASGKRGASR